MKRQERGTSSHIDVILGVYTYTVAAAAVAAAGET